MATNVVDVYRNLLRKCVSVRQNGKVSGYASSVALSDVEFRVAPAGVKRIRARGQREVVAYVRGTLDWTSDDSLVDLPRGAQRVCFNPFQNDSFVLEDGTPVRSADRFFMTTPCGSWVINPR